MSVNTVKQNPYNLKIFWELCTTLTPQIKHELQCIYHILQLWNVNEIYALTTVQYQIYCTVVSVHILILNSFDVGMPYLSLYIKLQPKIDCGITLLLM